MAVADTSCDIKLERRGLLIIHQSAELYGSDRSLLDALAGLDPASFDCLICLPEHGPLESAIQALGMEVRVLEVLKISRGLFSPQGMLSLPGRLRRSQSQLDTAVAGRRIDAVYTNTVAVMAGAIWASRHRVPHIWHIREIIEKPRWISWAIRQVVALSSSRILCNSQQTQQWINAVSSRAVARSQVIWNGVDAVNGDGLTKEVTRYGEGKPTLLLIGRINSWKGQDLLLESLAELKLAGKLKFHTVILGSAPPGQAHLEVQLLEQMEALGLQHDVEILPFVADAGPAYRAADAVVVPSRLPEPFGRVAIEAMAYGLPVVAAAHGGLIEIVVDSETGILVPPNQTHALADALHRVMHDESFRRRLGAAGQRRQKQLFSVQAYRHAVTQVLTQEVHRHVSPT